MAVMDFKVEFGQLCESIGLAVLLGQKVQWALAHYFAVFHMVKSGWKKADADASLEAHLSKPMGVVIKAISDGAPLSNALAAKVTEFRDLRNWLVHDFDQEATLFLGKGQRIDEYRNTMMQIVEKAYVVLRDLNEVGDTLIPVPPNKSCMDSPCK